MLPDFFYVLFSQKSSEYACCMFYTHFEKEKLAMRLLVYVFMEMLFLFYFVSILRLFLIHFRWIVLYFVKQHKISR